MKPTRTKIFDKFYNVSRIEYRVNGLLHREDGPAQIWDTGTIAWCLNGRLHREDGPAVIYPNGLMEWYKNGKEIDK